MEESAFNPTQRRLCPDGACVGLLGSDGCCRICGLRGDAGAPQAADSGSGNDSDEDLPAEPVSRDAADHPGDDRDRMAAAADSEGGGGFRADRRLCDDGSCVGVVDASGVCPVCGLRAAG